MQFGFIPSFLCAFLQLTPVPRARWDIDAGDT